MIELLGTPNDQIWPGFSKLPVPEKFTFQNQPYNRLKSRLPHLSQSGLDLLNRMLTFDPNRRISATDALNHEFFKENPLPQSPEFFPTWKESTRRFN